MGRFATGVAIITALDTDGRPRGVTVNSLTSLSLEPPLLLFSLRQGARLLGVIEQAGGFCVNILASHQQGLAGAFASRDAADPFAQAGAQPLLPPGGAPELPGAEASIQCTLCDIMPGGDHKILIGRGRSLRMAEDGPGPLLYFRSHFRTLAARGE